MELTYFQKQRAKIWQSWGIIIVGLVSIVASVIQLEFGLDNATIPLSFLIIATIWVIHLVASYSRTLLGGYRYFVWEEEGKVTKWNNGVKPTNFFAFGIPTYGLGLKPVVIIPKRGSDGWSLRVLRNGDLMLRDHEGTQQRFVFRGDGTSDDIRNPTEVLELLRDAYWADWNDTRNSHASKGTIWWAMRRREHRYWEAENPRRELVDALALISSRTDKGRKTKYPTWIRSPLGVWVHEFCCNVLGAHLPPDDPRRAELGVPDKTLTLNSLVASEVKAGPDAPLPKYTPPGVLADASAEA